MSAKKAVVLLNLGGPDNLEAVEPFLYNLFSDPDIFKLPLGFITQKWFARAISRRRAPDSARNYAAIGGKSPILDYTQRQSKALARALGPDYVVHICMRYWHPMADEVVAALRHAQIDHIILLPLYPQYSKTTTGSSINDFHRACARAHYAPDIRIIEHWYHMPGYHEAIAKAIRNEATKLPDTDPAHISLLFSAHGLPQKIVDQGDPYERHIRATFDAVATLLDWPDMQLCYQSRVGPMKWLEPYTDEVIRNKARTGTKQMLIYPIAFVSDHVETLHELAIEYAELASQAGISHYRVVPALNDDPLLINVLHDLVLSHV